MERISQEITELEQQAQDYEAQIANATDDAQVRVLVDQLNIVRNQLSEKFEVLCRCQEEQRQREEQIEEKVHAEDIPFAVAGIDFTGLPGQVITLIDAVVKADRRRIYNEHAVELEQLEQDLSNTKQEKEESVSALKSAYEEVQAEKRTLKDENASLRDSNSQLALDKADADNKRDAAVRERDAVEAELRQEIARLNSQIDDYQRAKVWGERQAQNIIDVTPEDNSTISAAVEAVRKLYVSRDDTYATLVKLVDQNGKELIVPRAEADSEWEAIEAPELPIFQAEEGDGNIPTEHDEPETSDGENVGVGETFETEVRRRLTELEAVVFGAGWAEKGEAA